VQLAARGSRKLHDGVEEIADATELRQIQRQARRVLTKATLAAVAATLIALALPR